MLGQELKDFEVLVNYRVLLNVLNILWPITTFLPLDPSPHKVHRNIIAILKELVQHGQKQHMQEVVHGWLEHLTRYRHKLFLNYGLQVPLFYELLVLIALWAIDFSIQGIEGDDLFFKGWVVVIELD